MLTISRPRGEPSIIGNETLKMLQFQKGLLSHIMTGIVQSRAKDFGEMYVAAVATDADHKQLQALE